jgi:hypothetical protein
MYDVHTIHNVTSTGIVILSCPVFHILSNNNWRLNIKRWQDVNLSDISCVKRNWFPTVIQTATLNWIPSSTVSASKASSFYRTERNSSNTPIWYPEGTWFESRPGHRYLKRRFSWFSSSYPCECPDSVFKQDTIITFRTLTYSFTIFSSHSTSYSIYCWNSVVKWPKNQSLLTSFYIPIQVQAQKVKLL